MAVLYPTRINRDNLGDTLINILLIRELSKAGIVYLDGKPDWELEQLVTRRNPYRENIRYNEKRSFVDGKPVLRWLRLLGKLPWIDVVFDPPGHYFEYSSIKTFCKSAKYITRAYVLKAMGKKMLRLGVNLGPYSGMGWNTQRKLSSLYTGIGVRDQSNHELLKTKGLKNLSLVDDISLLYKAQDFVATTDTNRQKTTDDYVVFSFRGATRGPQTDTEYLQKIIQFLSQFVQTNMDGSGTKLVLAHQVKEDAEVVKKIHQDLKAIGIDSVLMEDQLGFDDAINLYNGAKYIVTNRLHVALFSLLNNAPAIVVTNTEEHHKIVNVYEDLGLNELLFDLNQNGNEATISDEKLNTVMGRFRELSSRKRELLQQKISYLTRDQEHSLILQQL